MSKKLHFDLVVIGFGKAGKTLAGAYAQTGKSVALVEQSAQMYGGTCINIGCVPTKALVHRSERAASSAENQDSEQNTNLMQDWADAVTFRDNLTAAMRAKNKELLTSHESATLIDGHARFLSDTEVEVTGGSDTLLLTAENFVINTGATAVIPPIEGIKDSQRVFTSTEIQRVSPRPDRLAVVGAGPIGLEFAGMFAGFGSEVTVFNSAAALFSRNDDDVAQTASKILEESGVKFINKSTVSAFSDSTDAVKVSFTQEDSSEPSYEEFDAVLVATGRRPATDNLGLENTSIKLTQKGAVEVNEYLETSVPGIFAVGDVNGGPQFTYISLDDFRIVLDQLTGSGKRTTNERTAVPNTVFMTPLLSSVGITEKEAKERGIAIKVAVKSVAQIAAMPKAKILEDPRGIMKFIIDAETDQILGAQLLVLESTELINLVALAMRHKITATELQNSIFTHPSITEGLNEVLGAAQ